MLCILCCLPGECTCEQNHLQSCCNIFSVNLINYIVAPLRSLLLLIASYQKEYILQALTAKKHVLVHDPISTLLPEYLETLECAKQNGKFIQSSTMFVHQYRVQRFMNHVLQDPNFGRIFEVDASIRLNCDDVEKVGVKLPLRRQDGSIRVLGRFCVLVSTLFFNRLGSFAESARVKSHNLGNSGEIVSAECIVKFTKVSKMQRREISLLALVVT
jgi:hypothetical protein